MVFWLPSTSTSCPLQRITRRPLFSPTMIAPEAKAVGARHSETAASSGRMNPPLERPYSLTARARPIKSTTRGEADGLQPGGGPTTSLGGTGWRTSLRRRVHLPRPRGRRTLRPILDLRLVPQVARLGHPELRDVVHLRLGAIGVLPLEVEPLPTLFDGGRVPPPVPLHELFALRAPELILGVEIWILVEREELGFHALEQTGSHGEHPAEGLAGLEADRARARELPVHREGVRKPVALDDPGQGNDAILRFVRRPGDGKVPPRVRADEIAGVEGHDSVRERTVDELGEGGRITVDLE